MSHYTVINELAAPLISLLRVEDFTPQKRNTLEKPVVCMLSTVIPKMRIKRIQRKLSLPVSLLSLILPLLSLCLPRHHQSSHQSVREWPTGLHIGRADLLRAYYVLGPKSFSGLDIFIENQFCAVCLNCALLWISSFALWTFPEAVVISKVSVV